MTHLTRLIGLTGLIGIVTISLYYIVRGPFGTLNDVNNGLMAVLTAIRATGLHARLAADAPRPALAALAAAWLGAAVAVAGSVLVIFGYTGWYLAGLVTALGYAFIGLWVFVASRWAARTGAWPRRPAQWGQVLGLLMALGLLALPGILARVDTATQAPWWAHLGLAASLSWFGLYPLWCLWLASRPRARRLVSRKVAA
jgi:hypothetical protein